MWDLIVSVPDHCLSFYFTMYELIDIMRQKDDFDFAHLLNRLRLNEMTEEDKKSCRQVLLTVILMTIQRMPFIYLLRTSL